MSARYTGGLVYNAPGGWSGLFNGSNQYLSVSSQTALGMGAGDFTYEAWIYVNEVVPTNAIRGLFDSRVSGATGCCIYTSADNGTTSKLVYATNSAIAASSTNTIKPYVWTHVAVSRSSSVVRGFINGALEFTYTDSRTFSSSAATYIASDTSPFYFNGYISSARIVKGTAVYTTNFTPPTGALQPISGTSLLTCRYPTFVDGSTNTFTITNNNSATVSTVNPFPTSQLPNPALGGAGNGVYTMSQYAALKAANLWPAFDPYYDFVTLNLHGNGGAVLPFNTDASTNNFQVTQFGDASPSNYTPFIENGYWSNYFGGSQSLSNGTNVTASGNFTLECWINLSSYSAARIFFSVGNESANRRAFFINSSGVIRIDLASVGDVSLGGSVPLSTWTHIAITRSGSTVTAYVNGVATGTTATISGTFGNSNGFYVGSVSDNSNSMVGYISNLRWVLGSVVYSSNFTPPTTPLTAIANTSLLTCQSNRFIDNSTNAYTITVNGSPSVNLLQPFTAPTGTSAYGSGYFDGNGDWLETSLSATTFGSSNFTIECWLYYQGDGRIYANYRSNPGNVNGTELLMVGADIYFPLYQANTNPALLLQVAHGMVLNTWNHIAVTRSGSTFTIWINGVSKTTGSYAPALNAPDATVTYIGRRNWQGNTNYLTGYLSNFRVVIGTAVYTSSFTPSTTPLTAVSGTSLLTVQTNAPSQNNTFLDSSANNYPITRGGNATQGTFSPYGSNWSSYLGTNGNYFTSGTNAALGLSTGDWTIECFVYINQFVDNQYLIDFRPTGNSGATQPLLWLTTGGALIYFTAGGVRITTSNSVVSLNTWTHVVLCRASGTTRVLVNGTSVGSFSDSYDYGSSARFVNGTYGDSPGASNNNGGVISGYISNLRILKGTGLYTGSYTVPTAPLTAITNTSCLTHQSNRFIDNSGNSISITPSGSPSAQRFSPFTSTYYQPSVIGGSAYFDGTTANIITTNTITTIGTQDFCFEAWVYCFSTTSYACIIGNDTAGPGIATFIEMGTARGIFLGGPEVSLGSAQYNRWVHIAYSRVSGTYAGWVNGVRQATGSLSNNYTNAIKIGINNYVVGSTSGFGITGYIADGRVTVGSSPYSPSSTTITVPTAPLTAVTGTVFLASMTNAGVLDNAMISDLQTVGNAQISTSIKKYGNGSMYFDGSGDGLIRPASNLFDFNSGAFTVEFWAYCVSTSGLGFFASVWGDSGESDSNSSWLIRLDNGTILTHFMQGSGTYNILTSSAISTNTWFHFAWVRSGNTQTMYINGTSVASGTLSGSMNTVVRSFRVGYQGAATNYLNGYIDDLRVTKGVARYTTNFTPPTSQVQDQ